jgi:DNA polymerase-1
VSELTRVGPAEVRERYGVEPEQVPDFIALRGDPSDKLPGAPGVGPKKAAEVLAHHGSLEAALEAGRFSAHADELRLYRSIATLARDAPLPPLPDREPDWAAASARARAWGMNQLADRLSALAGT